MNVTHNADVSYEQYIYDLASETKGWLTTNEALMLMSLVKRLCLEFSNLQAIVEIGSYHGKSTILLGGMLKKHSPTTKVFAIDPHKGLVSTSDDEELQLSDSLSSFMNNITKAELLQSIEIVQNYSYKVDWNAPISLLFIDGLHDYKNVSRDFLHYADFVSPGCYVAFHDYSHNFPGVISFVNEILSMNDYKKIAHADTLIVLQKVKKG